MPTVSIIIPVYNVEAYLTECLHSVVTQTFKDMEIILIDDGSIDRSPEIMKTFADQDGRIKIITQPNGGVSAARNKGLHTASGEYILFIDSDDTVLPNAVETLYNRALEIQCDLLLGNVTRIHSNGEKRPFYERSDGFYHPTCVSGEVWYNRLMDDNSFPPLVYLFFMKRELILKNKIFFREGIIHEDELWCIKAILSAKKVSLIDFCYYNYFQRDGSLMNSNNREFRIKSLFIVCKELKKIAVKLNKENRQETVGSIFLKIFHLFFYINDLLQAVNEPKFNGRRYFSKLLEDIYPYLPYPKQRRCLTSYCFSSSNIQEKETIIQKSPHD